MTSRCISLFAVLALAAGATDITPRVGLIEIYGLRKVSAQKVRAAIAANPGEPLPSREDVEERIDKISGITGSRVEAACCAGSNMVLYVGVEERNAPHMDFNSPPNGDVTLPADLLASYRSFLDEVAESIRGRNADEDLTLGYSLMADPECRHIQQSFVPAVAANLDLVDRVLRQSVDPEQRAAAAYLMQYGPRGPHTTKIIVDGLQYALRDNDDAVRQNAMRALRAVSVGAKLHPDDQVRVAPTWFIELMNSVVWSDRRDASQALVNLTENRDPESLALLRDRALPSVLEMARWHDLDQALPPFILAGRLAGLDEAAIKTAWINGDRDAVLKKAANPTGKHSGISSVLHRPAAADPK
ncbi:MAG: hypothetical protein M3Y24_01395 [Acidobacteriota bacterium]|nr:hypothetical protein [Acidobacteriota bacterium]